MTDNRYENALLDPQAAYGCPDDVLADDSLTNERKREVLERWRAEAVHLQESEAEGFLGGENSMLDQIAAALRNLDKA